MRRSLPIENASKNGHNKVRGWSFALRTARPCNLGSGFKFAPDVKRRDVVNKVIAEKGEIAMAGTLLMEISQDEHQRAKYRSRRMFETDQTSNILTAEYRGKLEMVRNMKNKGFAHDVISEVSGFTLAEVEKA